ncbi:hypothetical protein Plec18167_005386 [Paecilomyces lecythidis]|uniref:MgtC/SapB/SrpB/YhiD N-terminal domain-containing protein n=1 Tax=Paecilomyces lecythidis TaxID=3004212 RepID=A0ABR3XJG8_9EURO
MALFSEHEGQQWPQICQLLLAVGLTSLIGIERQLRQKAAGLRTNTLVGMGSALFMLMSKYGFTDILERYMIVLDPSRIAAQIVSGVGFIGGGIIFKQASDVRGLTTAAAVWLSAAIGSACGAGLPILAAITTALYFVTVLAYPLVWYSIEKVRKRNALVESCITVRYRRSDVGLEPILEGILKAGAESVQVKRIQEVVMTSIHSPVMGGLERSATIQSTANVPGVSPLPPPMETQGLYSRVFDLQLVVRGHKSPNELIIGLSQLNSVLGVWIEGDSGDEV